MKKKELEKKTGGDCYQSAFQFISKFGNKGNFHLVHGTVYSASWKKRIDHAWCECGDVVFDSTIHFVGRKEKYYKIGNAKIKSKYTYKEAIEMAVKIGTYGDWSKEEK